jgi:Ni/Fe-hydrogenase 1 B-type cytochrome subunit
MKGHKLRRVYVWELPVRFYHWINALAIVVLSVTGYLIGNPPALMSGQEASDQYIFGWIRFIHFAAAYIFVFNFIIRIYWGFVGNKYASWKNFIPHSRQYLHELWEVLRIDIFLAKGKEHLSVGHNALAGFVYFIFFLASLLMVITGFGLYASMSTWWFADLFAWAPGLVGGDFTLRNIHHALMWFFIVFSLIHVYLVFYHDYVEGRGEISSIAGGWKFVEEEVFHRELMEEAAAERDRLISLEKEHGVTLTSPKKGNGRRGGAPTTEETRDL